LSMGSLGHRVDFDAAHYQATSFNELARLGTVGTVFHACCLLETTTNAFHIRMLPNSPTGYGSTPDHFPFVECALIPGGRGRPRDIVSNKRTYGPRGFTSTSRA
jgi:hypothetical protein